MCHMVMEEGWLFVADEGKQVLSNSDAVAACAHAFQEAMRDSTAFRASAE